MRARRLLLTIAATAAIVVAALALRADQPSLPDADLRNGRAFIQDNLWSTDTEQYAVWVAPDGTPYAGRRDRSGGKWQVFDLGSLPGNPLEAPTEDDLHNVYAIAVDSLGYVHVIGNSHADPLRYIRSERPHDITSWRPGTVAGSAERVTYPQLVGLPDGTLLFFRREGVPGDAAIRLDTLDADAQDWRHVGTVLDGRGSDESPYLHHVAVDPSRGTIHVLFAWRGDHDEASTNDLGYARSADGGRSWERHDGRPLALPITHLTAPEVIDTDPIASGLRNQGGLTVDGQGRPHGAVMFAGESGRTVEHVWLDGGTWRREPVNVAGLRGRPSIATAPSGEIWVLGSDRDEIVAIGVTDGNGGERRHIARVPAGWEPVYDTQALARHGTVELLVPDGAEPRVVMADLG
ncbi:MAG: BNR repeat-containing protein [Acidimicrobiales bacterium]